MSRLGTLGFATACVLSPCTVLAQAAGPVDFYNGKQISWILSAGEGGGYASYAHAFAPYFSAHIPGKPKIIVQNMPGAGGIRAMLYLANNAPTDGLTIGLVHSSVPFAPLYGVKGASFDPRQMNWIGSLSRATAICVAWHSSGVREWKDLFTKEYIVGGTGAGSQMETIPAMLNKLFGTKIKIVSGYKGGNDVYLAMERGEVSGRCGGLISSIRSTRADWFPQKKINVPVQVALERSADLPDVPTLGELVTDDRKKKILQLILSPQEMDRPILAPPGTPPERVRILQKAFQAAIRDPEFLAEARRQSLDIEEVSGSKVAEIIKAAFSMPPDIVKEAKESMAMDGGG
jgi:tripartite-type tricarboxylate transporter receptor subunit TctC